MGGGLPEAVNSCIFFTKHPVLSTRPCNHFRRPSHITPPLEVHPGGGRLSSRVSTDKRPRSSSPLVPSLSCLTAQLRTQHFSSRHLDQATRHAGMETCLRVCEHVRMLTPTIGVRYHWAHVHDLLTGTVGAKSHGSRLIDWMTSLLSDTTQGCTRSTYVCIL